MAIEAVIDASLQLDDSEYRAKLEKMPAEAKAAVEEAAQAVQSTEIAPSVDTSKAQEDLNTIADEAKAAVEEASGEVHVGLDDTELRRGLDSAENYAKQSFSRIALAVGAVTAAFAGITKGVSAVTQAFVTEQDSVNALQTALRIQGEEWNLNANRLSAFAGELQNVTKFGDETTRSAMALGLNMGLSVDNIEDATRAAMGLAEAHRMDLNSAMQLVARAAEGNTGRLSMYGIQVDNTKSKQEQFAQVLEQGGRLFNVATANAETLGGRMAQLGNIWGDLKERLGELLVGVFDLDVATQGTTDTLSAITEWLTDNMAQLLYYKDVLIGVFKTAQDVLAQVFGWVMAAFPKVLDNVILGIMSIPEFVKAVGRDMVDTFANVAKTIADIFRNWWTALRKVVTEGSFEGFRTFIDEAIRDVANTWNGRNANTIGTAKAVGAAMSSLPEFKLDFGEFDVQLEKAGDKLAQRLDRRFERRVDENFTRSNGGGASSSAPEAVAKNAVTGSFSAELLGMMLGYNSPQKETARNTKKTVEMLNKIYDRQDEGEVYA